jgi:disulfide bond formation protein DsbB
LPALPVGLLGGALFSQYVGGLYPCEMCYWQRSARGSDPLALGAMVSPLDSPRTRPLVLLAALVIAVSGAIGVFHAGVELGWWEASRPAPPPAQGASGHFEHAAGPLRPGAVDFSCFDGRWNAILSLGGAVMIVVLATRKTV